ncbi:MAG: DNA-binding protein [Burkholderiaceae bacterium]
MKTRTADEVRKELHKKGVSIAQWAVANGYSPQLVYEILGGKRQCLRGQSHAIAISLGMKAGEICTAPARALSQPRQRAAAVGV